MLKNKYKLREMILIIAMLFPMATLVENYLGFMNKMLMMVMCANLAIMVISKGKVYKRILLCLMYVVVTYLITLSVTPLAAIKSNPNMAIYYLFIFFYFIFFVENKENIKKELYGLKNIIFLIVISYTLVLTISIFIPSSYIKMTAGGWGEELYFASFSGSPNRVGPACLFIVTLITYLTIINYYKKLMLILIIPQLYTVYMGGSRTYLILVLCASLVFFYCWVNCKKKFWITIIPITIIMLVLIMHSNILEKITISLSAYGSGNNREFLRRLTNSRSLIWAERLQAFFKSSSFHQIFGNGINYTTYTFGLWSHSDFIEILCSYGYVGLFNYLALMTYLFKKIFQKEHHDFLRLIVKFIWFFNAFFNFFYCYFCSVLCYPLLLLIVEVWEESRREAKFDE